MIPDDTAGPEAATTARSRLDLGRLRAMVDARLDAMMAAAGDGGLAEAMRHALLAPGKRVRPLVTIAAARRYGAQVEAALDAACAVECVHAASLVLDDLPCMDDARLRRGRDATHVAHGESTAVLAAIGLLGLAFQAVAATPGLDAAARADLAQVLGLSIGARGLAAGQHADLDPARRGADAVEVRRAHALKTGALFAAAAECGAIVAGAGARARADMHGVGVAVGTTFQQFDDVLDATATVRQAGKDVRNDGRRATIVGLIGAAAAADEAVRHLGHALDLLGEPDRPDPLVDLLRGLHALHG